MRICSLDRVGTGKTSTARILAKAINCLADDPMGAPL